MNTEYKNPFLQPTDYTFGLLSLIKSQIKQTKKVSQHHHHLYLPLPPKLIIKQENNQ